MAKQPEKEVIWHEDQLIYRKLFEIEMQITKCKFVKDWEGVYRLLKDEWINVWAIIRTRSSEDDSDGEKHDVKWWKGKWNKVAGYLYDFRNDMDTPSTDRVAMRNFVKAADLLDDLNLLLNEYETAEGLRISTKDKSDPDKAMSGG